MKKLVVLIAILLNSTFAFADGVYSWEDSAGNSHFGNTPPPNALKLKKLAGNYVSKYSSAKLLKPLQQSRFASEEIIKPELKSSPTRISKEEARASLKEETLNFTELERGNLDIKYNKKNEITACAIVLRNTSAVPAANVLVTFEFEDGTLIPASGLDSISPDTTAKYEIPEDMLPISIRGYAEGNKKPIPKVEIKVGG